MEGSSSSPQNKRRKVDLVPEGSQFDRLPNEMVELILDFVQTPPNDTTEANRNKNNARLVCRRWNNITRPRLNYKGELNGNTLHSFIQLDSKLKIKSLVLSSLGSNRVRRRQRGLEGSFPRMRANKFGGTDFDPRLFRKSVEHLIVGGEAGIFLQRYSGDVELPYSMCSGFAEDHIMLRNIHSSIKGADLVNILKRIRDVKTLTLSSLAFISVSMANVKKINFSCQYNTITTFDLCIGAKSDPTKLAVLLDNATFPVLTSLYFRVYANCVHFSLFVNLYRFISKHPLLKSLSLSQAQAVYGLPKADGEYPALYLSTYPEMVKNLMKIKLEYLRMDCLIMGHYVGQEWKKLELAFIKNQTNLRGLELQVTLRTLDCSLDEIIPPCGRTLERLELSTCNIAPNYFDCSTISTFSRLKDCHLYLRNYFDTGTDDDLRVIRITDIHLLPSSIESLHLGRLPTLPELCQLKERLVNLRRVSYCCADLAQFHMTPLIFVQVLIEHLRFPRLAEFRMYQYLCATVTEFLHRQDGLISYIEDEDSVVVLVDRDDLDLDVFVKCTSSVPECTCRNCLRYN